MEDQGTKLLMIVGFIGGLILLIVEYPKSLLVIVPVVVLLLALMMAFGRKMNEQDGRRRLAVLSGKALGLMEVLPKHLRVAERSLDEAEANLRDRVFSPFWDAIEKTAKALGGFDEGVRRVKESSSCYAETLTWYPVSTPPFFPVSQQTTTRLGLAATAIARRMEAVVRNAQRDFLFALIYEQRKTNQLLVAGFATLGQALERMTCQITASLDDLAGSVDEVDRSIRALHSRIGATADTARQREAERAAQERQVLEMLDNIQRGRRPFP